MSEDMECAFLGYETGEFGLARLLTLLDNPDKLAAWAEAEEARITRIELGLCENCGQPDCECDTCNCNLCDED